MGSVLFKKFLEEAVTDLQMMMLYHGIEGILDEFENWLVTNGYLKMERGEYVSWED